MKDTVGWLFRRPVKTLLAWLAAVDPQPYPSHVERILVVREGGFGDVMLTIPILRALRAFVGPGVRIDALVREPVAGMLAENHVINALYAKGPNIWRAVRTIMAMRKHRYQVIVDLVSSPSLSFALWILAIAPRAHRVGGDKAELQRMYHQHIDLPPRPAIHFMERLRRIASFATDNAPVCDQVPWFDWPESVRRQANAVWRALVVLPDRRPDPAVIRGTNTADKSVYPTKSADIGRPDTPVRPFLTRPGVEDSADAVVLVNLSAGLPRRTWPVESYRQLLSILVPKYEDRIHRWAITAAPADLAEAAELAAAINRPEIALVPFQSDFRVVIELVGRVDLVLTPDTSILHAASAYGIPVVIFTVAENVISWAPWKIPSAVVSAPKGLPVSAIPVAEVAAAFERMASALDAPPSAPRDQLGEAPPRSGGGSVTDS